MLRHVTEKTENGLSRYIAALQRFHLPKCTVNVKSLGTTRHKRKLNIPSALAGIFEFRFSACSKSMLTTSTVQFDRIESQTAGKFKILSDLVVSKFSTPTVHWAVVCAKARSTLEVSSEP